MNPIAWVSRVGPGTLREELNLRGYTDHASEHAQRREIRRGQKLVATLTADAAWKWLERRDAKLRTINMAASRPE